MSSQPLEHGLPTSEDQADAEQCFAQAINYIERERWADAANSLHDALDLVPGFPQAADMLNLVEDIRRASSSGEDARPEIDALRGQVIAIKKQSLGGSLPPVRQSLESLSGIARPWADDAPVHRPSARSAIDSTPAIASTAILPHLTPLNPFDQLKVLGWFFLRPAAIKLYYADGRNTEVQRVAGWVASTIMWLVLALPALGFATGKLPTPVGGGVWMLGVVFVLWAVCGWLMAFEHTQHALMLASAAWLVLIPGIMSAAGNRSGAVIALIFMLLAGFAAAVAGIESKRGAIHLALGATFVALIASVFKTFLFIAPIINAYTRGFILASVGAPILIAMVVIAAGLLTIGITFVIPYLGSYWASFTVEAVLEDNLVTGVGPLGAAALTWMITCYMILAWISFAGGWQVLNRL